MYLIHSPWQLLIWFYFLHNCTSKCCPSLLWFAIYVPDVIVTYLVSHIKAKGRPHASATATSLMESVPVDSEDSNCTETGSGMDEPPLKKQRVNEELDEMSCIILIDDGKKFLCTVCNITLQIHKVSWMANTKKHVKTAALLTALLDTAAMSKQEAVNEILKKHPNVFVMRGQILPCVDCNKMQLDTRTCRNLILNVTNHVKSEVHQASSRKHSSSG